MGDMGGPTVEELAEAELLEQMAAIYPGDPDGALTREICRLRQVPEPPALIITVTKD